jgi:anti-sigma factor RsiW
MRGKGKLMNCSDISELAPLYLTGELEPARAEAFAGHVGECAACREEIGQQEAFDRQLRSSILEEDIDNRAVDQRVRDRIDAGRRTSRRRLVATSGIAAVLLIGIVGYKTISSSRTKLLDAAAARDHRLELVDLQPRNWFADRASIERLAGRQGLPVSVAAFAPAGYRLAKGKLCLLDGQVFLHLVYTNDTGNFSLFLRRPADGMAAGIHTGTFSAEYVAGFQDTQVIAMIVSERPGDQVLRLARSAASFL